MIVLAGESGRKREGMHVMFEVNMIVINYIPPEKKNHLLSIQRDASGAGRVVGEHVEALPGVLPVSQMNVSLRAQSRCFNGSALSCNCYLGYLAACLFSSQFLLVFSLAFSCYFQEAAFRMASGFPDRTPPPRTPHSSYRETMGGLLQGHEEAVCVCVRALMRGDLLGEYTGLPLGNYTFLPAAERPSSIPSGLALGFRLEINWGEGGSDSLYVEVPIRLLQVQSRPWTNISRANFC